MNLDNWGLLGETAQALVGDSEVNPTAVAYCLLALLGANLSSHIVFTDQLEGCNLNLFVLLVGPSGVSRKSTAMKRAHEFWHTFVSSEVRIIEGVGSGEGLARMLGGGTPAAPIRACLLYDETMQFAQKATIDGSSLLSIFNSLYDGRTWENQVKRSDQSSRVDGAILSFMGASTPEVYASLWSEGGVGMGLLNRFLLVDVPIATKAVFQPRFATLDRKNELGDKWKARMDANHMGFRLEWTKEALEQATQWYMALDRTKATSVRLDELFNRLLLLHAWCLGQKRLTKGMVQEVIGLIEAQILSRSAYWHQTSPLMQRIETALTLQPLTTSQLYKYLHAERLGDQFPKALDSLEKSGIIQRRYSLNKFYWHPIS